MSIRSTYTGPHMLDCTILQGKRVDIMAGGMRGFRTDMEGAARRRGSAAARLGAPRT